MRGVATHPTLLESRCIRLGNTPAISSLATCCGVFGTSCLSSCFKRARISIP